MIKISGLTWLISIPALSWFVAMLFTSALDVTAIYASSAFFAYFFSMILLKQPLSRITLGSIALAFAGVLVISLAGEGEGGEGAPSNRSLGDIVMLFGK
jgi:drug/metabolite transporter (DMT)-like permease